MANNPFRYGFRWHSALQGVSQEKPQRMRVASGLASVVNPGAVACDLNVGDLVKQVNDGSVAMCVAADPIYGVVAGFSFVSASGSFASGYLPYSDKLPTGTTYVAGDAQIFAHVVPVAGQIFEAMVDDNVTFTTDIGVGGSSYLTAIHENVEYIYTPDAASKQARPRLQISSHAPGALSWRIHDLSRRIDVDPSGTNYPLLVICSRVQQAPYTLAGT